MKVFPNSDLSRSMFGLEFSARLKNRQTHLSHELTTGQVADPVRHLRGDLSSLSSLVRNDALHTEFIQNNQDLSQRAEVVSLALSRISQSIDNLIETVVIGPQTNLPNIAELGRGQAESSLNEVFAALKSHVAGRHLFSGTSVTSPPLPDTQQLLDAIDTVIAGETSASGIIAQIDSFFAPGGDFETSIYLGSNEDLPPSRIDENETIALEVRADDQALRDIMKAAAYAYGSASPTVSLYPEEQRELLSFARDFTLRAKDVLLDVQAKTGLAESRIEETIVRLRAHRSASEQARSDLLGIDTFEVATRLEDVNARLEMLYTTTVRAAQLSFLDYMR